LELLEHTSLGVALNAKQGKLAKQFASLDSVFKRVWSGAEVNLSHWKWADITMWSRVISAQSQDQVTIVKQLGEYPKEADPNDTRTISSVDTTDDLHLIPFIDMANHSLVPQLLWQITNKDIRLISSSNEFSKNTSPFKTGTELCISYGYKSNSELLFLHGFCLKNNPQKEVTLPAPLMMEDPLIEQKAELIKHWGLRPMITFKRESLVISINDWCVLWLCAIVGDEDGVYLCETGKKGHVKVGDKVVNTAAEFDREVRQLPIFRVIELRVVKLLMDLLEFHLNELMQSSNN